MNYYKINGKTCFSVNEYNYEKIDEIEFEKCLKEIYFLYEGKVGRTNNSLIVTSVNELFTATEDIEELSILKMKENIIDEEISNFIKEKIKEKKVIKLNISYGINFDENIFKSKKVNLLGLGDVGGTLLIGLRLLGKGIIEEIGIYDLNEDRMKRYEMELNQIVFPNDSDLPKIKIIGVDDLFNCDAFIFTASKFVPEVGNEKTDVRMIQYQANKKIVTIYAKMARKLKYKGMFFVVSDPVDLLCNVVYYESNSNDLNEFDGFGLLPNKVRGFGLGVMNGRANYYSEKMNVNYKNEGRVFGPHGSGLIVADSIKKYSDINSLELQKKVIEANLRVRDAGFKPYIAPALSSGALSIIETLKGNYNYSTVFIDGIYWGVRNKLINGSVEIERLDLSEDLLFRIKKSYMDLRKIYEEN